MIEQFDRVIQRYGKGSIKWEQYGKEDVLALSTADMDFLSSDHIRASLVKRAEIGVYGYQKKGDSYYQTIVDWFARRQDARIEREWILNSPGIWSGTRIIMETYANPDDRVIVHAPHFGPLMNTIRGAKLNPVTTELRRVGDHFEVDFEDFRSKLDRYRPKVFFLVHPHNPTGHSFTEQELIHLATLCKEYGTLLVSDEVHSGIVYKGRKHFTVLRLPEELRENVVLITGPSKAYNVMGLTYGLLIIPDLELREQYSHSMDGYDMNFATNIFGMAATEAAYHPESDGWLDALNRYMQDNLDFLCSYMEEYIPEIRVIRPDSSYLVWLDCRALKRTPEELKTLFLHKAKVGLTWGEGYGPAGEGYERINIGCPRATLEEALRRIRNAVHAK